MRASSFEEVTVEQIADRADVSPSTVYRYFGTKEDILLWDESDDSFLESFVTRLETESPGTAMVESMAALFKDEDGNDNGDDGSALEHLRFIAAAPPLQAALSRRVDEIRRLMAEAIARSGWPRSDASTFAGAVVGAYTGAIEAWVESNGAGPLAELLERTTAIVAGLDERFTQS